MSELKETTFPGALDEFLGKIMAAMVREYAPANNVYVAVLNQCKHLDARLQAANKTIESLKLRIAEVEKNKQKK